jgi:hypothetical protein
MTTIGIARPNTGIETGLEEAIGILIGARNLDLLALISTSAQLTRLVMHANHVFVQ